VIDKLTTDVFYFTLLAIILDYLLLRKDYLTVVRNILCIASLLTLFVPVTNTEYTCNTPCYNNRSLSIPIQAIAPQAHAYLCMLASDTNALSATFDSDSVPIIVDSGASVTLTHSMRDFISYKDHETPRLVTGISSGLSLKGQGTVMWHVVKNLGQIVPITIKDVQYVPDLAMRLLSPQQLLQQDTDPKRYFSLYPSCEILRWDWNIIRIAYDSSSFLSLLYTAEGNQRYKAFVANANSISNYEQEFVRLQSVTLREKAYLRWHHRMVHPSEAVMHALANAKRIPQWLSTIKAPLCKACQFGK